MNCRNCNGGLILVKRKVDQARFAFRCSCNSGNYYSGFPTYSHTFVGYESWITETEISSGGFVKKEVPAANFLANMDVSREATEISKDMAKILNFRYCDFSDDDTLPI